MPRSQTLARGLPRRQRGVSLVSALVACVAVALGLLAATRAQSHLRAAADDARQRSQAIRLAQAEIERVRAFSRLAIEARGSSYDGLESGSLDALPASAAATYTLTRTVAARAAPDLKAVQVDVAWLSRRGEPRRLRLATLIGRRDPALGGALMQPAHGRPLARVLGRDARVPPAASDLGDGRSVLKPAPAGTRAVLIDNASGAVSAICSVAATTRTHGLGAADLVACSPQRALLLSGRVRFSLGAAPSALAPNDAPLAFEVALTASSASADAAACGTEAHATADGERWVDYTCVVAPAADAAGWSGRADLVPLDWRLGAGAGHYRVCRYSADHDASGAVERASEHPADYRGVSQTLAQQNFLVIAGPQACPTGAPAAVDGGGAENYADLSTVQHQP